MTPENFCYWLQGYFELNGNHPISLAQSVIINEHLNLVFKKQTTIALRNDNRQIPLYLAVANSNPDIPLFTCGHPNYIGPDITEIEHSC